MNQSSFPVRIKDDANRRARTLQDLLSLVMPSPPALSVILRWTADQREHAEDWAERERLAASDNPARRIRRPDFVDQGARAWAPEQRLRDREPIATGVDNPNPGGE